MYKLNIELLVESLNKKGVYDSEGKKKKEYTYVLTTSI